MSFNPHNVGYKTERPAPYKPPPVPQIPLRQDGTPRPSAFALRTLRIKRIERWHERQKLIRLAGNDN